MRESRYAELLSEIPAKGTKIRIIFHSASMGEFEQAKPIIELLKNGNLNLKASNLSSSSEIEIIASFYSPSGLENQLDYEFVDYFVYLPFDSRSKIKSYFDVILPDLIVIIRYEYWFNFIDEICSRSIPSLLISATKPNGTYQSSFLTKELFNATINKLDTIYSNDDESFNFYKHRYNNELIKSSDTRFDRIIERVELSKTNPILNKSMFENKFVIILGSSWEQDEHIFMTNEVINNPKLLLIFVPHEPTEKHISQLQINIKNSNSSSVLLSELLDNKVNIVENHIIVDSIGKLLNLYSLADAVYIGGGFGAGVHSVTEPAGYGLALASAPKMTNSPDAIILKSQNCLEIINNSNNLINWIDNTLFDEKKRKVIEEKSRKYLLDRRGSSQVVYNKIKELIN